ncbi:MAG: hypothetical protein RLZZ600_339, partial [Actinomycetota bacterium]
MLEKYPCQSPQARGSKPSRHCRGKNLFSGRKVQQKIF